MSENTDEIARLIKQLDKAIEVLGSPSIDVCPDEYGLSDTSAKCPEHQDCHRCWDDALSSIE